MKTIICAFTDMIKNVVEYFTLFYILKKNPRSIVSKVTVGDVFRTIKSIVQLDHTMSLGKSYQDEIVELTKKLSLFLQWDNGLFKTVDGLMEGLHEYHLLNKKIYIDKMLITLSTKYGTKIINLQGVRTVLMGIDVIEIPYHWFKKSANGLEYVDSFSTDDIKYIGPDYILFSDDEDMS